MTSQAEVIARGVAAMATVHAATPLGTVADHGGPVGPTDQRDEPIILVSLSYEVDGRIVAPAPSIAVRVPHGREAALEPGSTVAVRYLPEDPDVVAIDWGAS